MDKIEGNFGKRFVEVSGGYGNIGKIEDAIKTVEEIDSSGGTVSQLLDGNAIAGKEHLLHSAKLALEALERGRSFADSARIELTCWVAGSRQIDKSIERVGIKEDSDEIGVITIGGDESKVRGGQREIFSRLGIDRDEEVLDITDEKVDRIREIFSISEDQLDVASLEEIVLEKVALLSLEQ